MQRLVLSASVLALVSGVALAAPAQAGSYHRHGGLSAGERASIARSAAHLNAVKRHARVRIGMAQARHNALVRRLRHN